MDSRRDFLKKSLLSGTFAGAFLSSLSMQGCADIKAEQADSEAEATDEKLKEVLTRPVLKKELFPDPVLIESLDLIKIGGEFLVRARSTDGAEGFAVSNWGMGTFYPIFVNHVSSFFKGKDARDLDRLIEECFLGNSHYKMQSMAIWTPIASAELAILDLLGQTIKRPAYDYLGELTRPTVEIYWANNYRGHSAEESVRQIVERYEQEQPPAVKVKIAGRMGAAEVPEGRTEKMIPLLREQLGDEVVIYADANGGYQVKEAIRIGKILEEHQIGFFEEPCPFYDLWETKEVADNLNIPVAAGEQESSQRRFRWMVANKGAQVLQPDLFYYGGLIRSIRVARMAGVAGLECTPHVSGGGMNMLYIAHFAAMVSNAGPHQEYKSPNENIRYELLDGNITAESGRLKVPGGPGFGFQLDPDWIASGQTITKKDLL